MAMDGDPDADRQLGAAGRPRVHFTPDRGWMNDPMGIVYVDHRYHLFFQHVPWQSGWDVACEWGHASSKDLLTWSRSGSAIVPDGPDEVGCWTGAVVARDDREPTMFYTSVGAEPAIGRIRRAAPSGPDLESWDKLDVVVEAPSVDGLTAFRDPFVFEDGGAWSMIVGAGRADGTACAFVYRSADLERWEYVGELASRHTSEREGAWTGSIWECPQLVRFDDVAVLIVSVWDDHVTHRVAGAIGTYADGRFVADRWQTLTHGTGYYAASAFADESGEPGLMMWIRGIAGQDDSWVGAQSLPLRISIEDGRLELWPHPNLVAHRRADPIGTPAFDVEWDLEGGSGSLTLRSASGIAASASATADHVKIRVPGVDPVDLPSRDRLRIVVDGPVLEAFTGPASCALPLADAVTDVSADRGRVRTWRLR